MLFLKIHSQKPYPSKSKLEILLSMQGVLIGCSGWQVQGFDVDLSGDKLLNLCKYPYLQEFERAYCVINIKVMYNFKLLDLFAYSILSWKVELGQWISLPRFWRKSVTIWDSGIVMYIGRLQLVGCTTKSLVCTSMVRDYWRRRRIQERVRREAQTNYKKISWKQGPESCQNRA